MSQRYSPEFWIESAMGPTTPMLFDGPLRRIKLTSSPGVVTFHLLLVHPNIDYQNIECSSSDEGVSDRRSEDGVCFFCQIGIGGTYLERTRQWRQSPTKIQEI
jgi:hypothetical protein